MGRFKEDNMTDDEGQDAFNINDELGHEDVSEEEIAKLRRKIAAKKAKKWRIDNPDKLKETQKKYRTNNSNKCSVRNKKWRNENVEKVREMKRQWAKDNPDRVKKSVRKTRLKQLYNTTVEDVNNKILEQNGLCGVCDEPKQLVIDHCHNSGNFRGMLCRDCNLALGLLRDKIDNLTRAINYLVVNNKK